ncbi:ERF family protein, partial [Klebsiella pneumoniae]
MSIDNCQTPVPPTVPGNLIASPAGLPQTQTPVPSSSKPTLPNKERSLELSKLATALSKAQGTIRFAVKDATNPHFKSKYADLAAVWEACRDALAANELSVTQLPSAEGLR